MFFIVRFFWYAVGPAKKWLVLGNALQIAVAVTELAMMWLVVQAVLQDASLHFLWWALALLFVRGALNYFETATTQGHAKAALPYVSEVLYKRLITLDAAQLPRQGPAHLSRIFDKVRALYVKLENAEYSAVFMFSGLLMVLGVMALESVLAAALFAGWVAFMLSLVWLLSRARVRQTEKAAAVDEALEQHVADSFAAVRHVAGYGHTRTWWYRMQELAERSRIVRRVLGYRFAIVSALLYVKMDMILLGIAALPLLAISISSEVQLFVLMYFTRMTRVITAFHVHLAQMQEVAADARFVRGILERQPKIMSPDTPEIVVRSEKGAAIELRDVYVSFNEQSVLSGASMIVEPGSVAALVGATGAGKSTILSLIQRIIDPDRGEVLVEGQNVTHLDVPEHRQRLGWVSQEPHVFSGAVRDNVQLLRADASDGEVWQALVSAGIEAEVRQHPERLDASASEVFVSGGQKQRLEVARVILSEVDVVLLDEPTSALDSVTAHQVVSSTLEGCRETGKTVICITHDLGLLQYADQALEVADGKIRPLTEER